MIHSRKKLRNRSRPPKKRRTSRPPSFRHLEETLFRLQEHHLKARKRYFEFFQRANPQQLDRLKRQFDRTLHELRTFEKKLPPDYFKKAPHRKKDLALDTTYSQNHGHKAPSPLVEGEISDPHFLPTQQEANYTDDREESVGTQEDYEKYKDCS